MTTTTREEPNNNPVVVVSIIVMALTAMVVLAYNLFIQPIRSTDLNPVGKEGSRISAPQSAPEGAINTGATGTMK